MAMVELTLKLKAIDYGITLLDASLWLPGKKLVGFVSPNMPDILLLPWFDNDGKRIAFAWCDLTPERRQFLQRY